MQTLLFIAILSFVTASAADAVVVRAPNASARAALTSLRIATGCVTWRRLSFIRTTGASFADGLSGRFSVTVDARNGRWTERIDSEPDNSGDGFDGRMPWTRALSGASHDLNAPAALQFAKTSAWLFRRGWCADDAGASYVGARAATEHARRYELVTFLPRGGTDVTIWIDLATHLLDRTVRRLEYEHEVDRFFDWRTVGAMTNPFIERTDFPEEESTSTFRSFHVSMLASVGTKTFARPVQPNDVRMRGGVSVAHVPYVLEDWKPIVDVRIDGHGPLPFVLDTGGHFILTERTARLLGYSGSGNGASTGAGTAIRATRFVRLRSISIGAAIVHDPVAEIIAYGFNRTEHGLRPPTAGFLGAETLERFRTTFDPRTHTIDLEPLSRAKANSGGVRLPLRFSEDAPNVDCELAGRPALCMVDTGNQSYTFAEGIWASRVGLTRVLTRGLKIRDGVYASRQTLRLGTLPPVRTIVDYHAPAARGSEATSVYGAILSERLLDQFVMTIDYRVNAAFLRPARTYVDPPFDRSGIFAEKQRDGTFVVRRVFEHSSAAAAKMREGDRIVAIDGIPAAEFSGAAFAKRMAGGVGTRHRLLIATSASVHERIVVLRLKELL